MSEMSVYDKATQLQNHARRLAAGAAGDREAGRIAERIAELRVQLNELRQQISVARALQAQGAYDFARLSDVEDGRVGFERKAQPGALPSNDVFKTARQKVKAATQRAESEVQAAWSTWSNDRLSALPLARIPMLPPDEQQVARERRAELERAAKNGKATTSGIAVFAATSAALAEMLHDAQDPPDELLALLDRLGKRPVSLREVTDEEIALLRAYAIDDQIGLLRKGA
ncbi:hypothetical protein ABH940_003264 [Streptacidiphilus sp. BW17]|uniref:hypothetical protein n=1 Tax=unclassified Streptacidiphilus TaxID=2643834 RepID=UPI0035188F21